MIKTTFVALFILLQGASQAPAPPATAKPATALLVGVSLPEGPSCRPVNLLDSPEAIRKAGFQVEFRTVTAPPVDPCPTVFADCEDQPGRRCRETNCNTTDTGDKRCQQPNGMILKCTGSQTIHVTACGCTDGPTLICCFDESCGFECGTCGLGSQTIFCQ